MYRGFWIFAVFSLHQTIGAVFDPALEDAIAISDDGAVHMINGLPDMRSQEMMFRNEKEIEPDLAFGDIVEYKTNNNLKQHGERRKRYVLDDVERRWTRGIIPYTFDDSLPETYRSNYLQEVFPRFEYWTHFRFVRWNASVPTLLGLDHQNYLIFVKTGQRCWSYLGNIRPLKGQRISCCRQARCVHEIGHALGFYHEQSNPMRDDFVRINFENIAPGAEANFMKNFNPRARHFGYYDAGSFMSYGRKVHSKNGYETITSLDDEAAPVLKSLGTSDFYMFKQAQEVYRMKELKCPDFSLHCDNDGYVSYVNGSCRCRCTPGMDPGTGCTTPIHKATCGGMLHLDDVNRNVTITSPDYPNDYTGSTTCTWFIKAPVGSRIKLEFTEFELHETNHQSCNGHVEIRSMLPGEPGIKFCGSGIKKTIISRSYMMSIFLTGTTPATTQTKVYTAKRFSASLSLIKEEDLCYTNQGKDNSYHGNVNITRDFRPCIPWDRVTHCRHHVFSDTNVTLEGNYCRNPGDGTQPWCYTDADGCRRGYCDVCKLGRCYDLFADCQNLIASDAAYCQTNPEARRGCRQSCGWCGNGDKKPESISRVTCPPPSSHPSDAVTPATMMTKYSVGDTIEYLCKGNLSEPRQIVCTSEGTWSRLRSACKDGSICIDERHDCHILLERNPTMCLKYRHFAEQQCSQTCNACLSSHENLRNETCTEPIPSANTTLSSKGPYYIGDVIAYSCKEGYVLKGGNLARACTGNDQFTGTGPVCYSLDESRTEINQLSLRQREKIGMANQLYLLNNDIYRINRSGEIVSWNFYNLQPGRVQFMVFRQLRNTKWFKLVGANEITDTNPFRINFADVTSRDRIAVESGDFIGIYLPRSSPSGITYDACNTAFNPEGQMTWAAIRIPSRWQKNRYYSMRRDNTCKLVSVNAVIGPTSRRRLIYFG